MLFSTPPLCLALNRVSKMKTQCYRAKHCFIVLFQLFMEFIDENTQFYKLLYNYSKNIYTTVIVFFKVR